MNKRNHYHCLEAMNQLISYYYKLSPGSIMPLFLLYLARIANRGEILFKIDEKASCPLDWKDKEDPDFARRRSEILSQFTKDDAAELAKTDPAGASLLEKWRCNEMDHMSIVLLYGKESHLNDIRSAFQKHDEELGDSMQRRRALFFFVHGLEQCTPVFLKEYYLEIADMILKHADVFKDGENSASFANRIILAKLEKWILRDVSGRVFVPYSRTPYAAAMLNNVSICTESTGPDCELASMVSELIIRGNGIDDVSCMIAERPYESCGEAKYDVVVLDYESHNENKRFTTWHSCLAKMKSNLSDKARYVGLVDTKMLFKMVGKQGLFKGIIDNKSLEGIVLLPRDYRLALVSVNKAKKNPDYVSMVNLYNEKSIDSRFFRQLIKRNSKRVSIEELSKAQTTLESFFEERIPELEGYRLEPLRKYLKIIPRRSQFGVSDAYDSESLSIIRIDKKAPYNPFRYYVDTEPYDSFSIYEPMYYLDTPSLIVNEKGNLDARLYGWSARDPESRNCEPALFSDGLAFAITRRILPSYIINELRKPYVESQLNRWSSSREMLHSEDEILNLRIYIPESKYPLKAEWNICKDELDASILPNGEIIENDDEFDDYVIEKCLGKGGFGISYKATRNAFWDPKTVVLKEFFGRLDAGSVRFDDVRVAMSLGSIESIRQETDLHSYLVKFIDEAETMKLFSRFKGSRIREARNLFLCRKTNTYYYEMDYYCRGTLEDELKTYGPMTEAEFIERVMKPISVALDTMHNNSWLHLDIKAPNIIIDDEGQALLGDLGISQHYDGEGKRITKGGDVGTQGLCARQQYDLKFVSQFHPELDVYSFAGMMYLTFSGIDDLDGFTPDDLNDPFLELSDQTKEALRLALDPDLKTTPKSVRDFMHMLPGCEDMVFEDILPIEEETDVDSNDFNLDDFEDMPYFT